MNFIAPDPGLGHACRQGDVDRAAGREMQRTYRGFTILVWPLHGQCCTASWGPGGTAHWLGFFAFPELALNEACDAIDRRLQAAREAKD